MEQIVYIVRRSINMLLCGLIKTYQYVVSPCLRSHCRYYPSCSTYALLAIQHFGPLKGLWFSLCRILRCHPWAKGGYDPILPNKENL